MDKLTTLLACLPKSPFKDNLTEEIESLRQQLADSTKRLAEYDTLFRLQNENAFTLKSQLVAASAACEAKDALIRPIAHNILVNPRRNAEEALAIKPDASALKARDEALIERCAEVCEEHQGSAETCAAAIRELKEEL